MELVKKIRDKKGWSAYQMAKEMGISHGQYANLEHVAKSCGLPTLLKLKKISGLSWARFGELIEKEVGE